MLLSMLLKNTKANPMSTLLEHLNKETLPDAMVVDFVNWCVWQQACPALVRVLQAAGLYEIAEQIASTTDLDALGNIAVATDARQDLLANDRKPLRISALEATFHLVQRLVEAAHDRGWDPEGVAFFSEQICGWSGFALSAFSDTKQKEIAEAQAHQEQITYLSQLWQQYGASDPSHA